MSRYLDRSNLVEILGLLVAAASLVVSLSEQEPKRTPPPEPPREESAPSSGKEPQARPSRRKSPRWARPPEDRLDLDWKDGCGPRDNWRFCD